jgi:hypothetical protein
MWEGHGVMRSGGSGGEGSCMQPGMTGRGNACPTSTRLRTWHRRQGEREELGEGHGLGWGDA